MFMEYINYNNKETTLFTIFGVESIKGSSTFEN